MQLFARACGSRYSNSLQVRPPPPPRSLSPAPNIPPEYPQCWELDARFLPDVDESESESEAGSTLPPSAAYKDFLRFLELGCRGSPKQGYPALVIVLSTIPHPVRISP